MTMRSEFSYSSARRSECCGQIVILERRYMQFWGGETPLDTILKCGDCGQVLAA